MQKIKLDEIHYETCGDAVLGSSRFIVDEKLEPKLKAKWLHWITDIITYVGDLSQCIPPNIPDFEECPLEHRIYYSDGEHHLLYLTYGSDTQVVAYEDKDDAILVGNFMGHPSVHTSEFLFRCSDGHDYWPCQCEPEVPKSLIIAMYSMVAYYA